MWPFKPRTPEILTRSEIIYLLPNADYIEVLDNEYQIQTDKEFMDALGFDNSKYGRWNNCNHFVARAVGKLQGRGWPVFKCWINGTINDSHSVIGYVNAVREWRIVEAQTSMYCDDIIKKYKSITG